MTVRTTPYTAIGIRRLVCFRCGARALTQWQVCAWDLEIIHQIHTDRPRELEKLLHAEFAPQHMRREWFEDLRNGAPGLLRWWLGQTEFQEAAIEARRARGAVSVPALAEIDIVLERVRAGETVARAMPVKKFAAASGLGAREIIQWLDMGVLAGFRIGRESLIILARPGPVYAELGGQPFEDYRANVLARLAGL